MKKVAIIGSGISALTRAWALSQKGHECTVLESSDSVGGAIQSIRAGNYLAEEGPNSIQVNGPVVDAFLRSIPGLEARVVTAAPRAKKRFIARGGKLHAVPMGPLQAVTTGLWSLRGRIRALKDPFIRPINPEQEESAADFVRRRLGSELYDYAMNPLIGGIYAGDPEQLSLRYAFPKLYALEQNHGGLIRGGLAKMPLARKKSTPAEFEKRILSFKNGLAELPQRLAQALGKCVITGAVIERIVPSDHGWLLEYGGISRVFDRLIVTVPAHALVKLPFPTEIIAGFNSLRAIAHPPVSVISLAFKRSEVTHPLDGFGALVPECEQRKILGVLFPSSLFPGRAPKDEVLLTTFVGGERQPELATEDTQTLKSLVLPELRELLGVRGDPTFVHHRHWSHAIPQYKLGYSRILEKINHIELERPGLQLAGNYRTGISLTDCIESALSEE